MKSRITTIFALILILALAGLISASYKYKCLSFGESLPSSQNPIYTCKHDLCQLCVNSDNYPTHPGYCSKSTPCKPSSPLCDNSNPLVMGINSPGDNFVFNSRKVNFNLTSNKLVTFYYLDNINGRGRWSRLTSRAVSYAKGISFKDGLNEITIKAVDNCDKSVQYIRKFYVDSKKPKLRKADTDYLGSFKVEFTEDNPAALLIKFGNSERGFMAVPFNINNDCAKGTGGKYSCEMKVGYEQYLAIISPYSDENVQYWFELYDILNNSAKSKPAKFYVDITFPIINNPDSMLVVNGKYVNFNIQVTEAYFKEISFYDNSETNPKWVKLCTTLKNGVCEKKVSFKAGEHIIDIKVLDKSGNFAIKRITINID